MSVVVDLIFNCGFKWFIHEGIYVKGYAYINGNSFLKEKGLIDQFIDIDTEKDFEDKIKSLNGQFSVIYNRNNKLYLAVDPCRNFPIFYVKKNENIYVSDSVEKLIGSDFNWDELGKEEFLATGFVTNKFTLVNGIFQVQAGSIVSFCKDNFYEKFYHQFAKSFTINHIGDLEEIFEHISYRLLHFLNGKTVVLSLSGGYDSRLIACMLKKLAYKNVICYSYGIPSSVDVKMSKKVAKELGFKWVFVPCNEETMKGFPDSQFFKEYYSYASNYVSGFFTQDYFAVNYLNKNKIIPHDSVFLAGHSGDTLSGSHLFKGINEENILELLYKKHYNENYAFDKFKTRIGLGISNIDAYENYDNWNIKERQSKFIINSCRVYEYFGYTYYLPLWDKELVSFFANTKFKQRLNQKIYIETIFEHYFKPMSVAFKKKIFRQNFNLYIFSAIFRRLKRFVYKDDLNCKLSAKKLLKHTPLNMNWDSAKININTIISAWYIRQIEKKH